MNYTKTDALDADIPEDVRKSAHAFYEVWHEGELVLYAGIEWHSRLSRQVYIWIIPKALGRKHLRPLREMVDALPINEALAIIDVNKPHLLKWIAFFRFGFAYELDKNRHVYQRKY